MQITARTAALVLCVLAAAFDSSAAYVAPPCDPNAILRQNGDSYQSNMVVWLSYVNNLIKSIPDAALNEDAFQFSVDWYPNYSPKSDFLVLKVTNGKIDGAPKVHVKYPISKPFMITRDASKTLFISASIDSQSDIVSLPARPKFVIKMREKYEPPLDKPPFHYIEDGGHSLDPIAVDYCISSSPDSILLPSTMIPQVLISGDPGRARATVNENKHNNSLKACGRVYDSTPCTECSNQIKGRFSIWEAYIADAPKPVLD